MGYKRPKDSKQGIQKDPSLCKLLTRFAYLLGLIHLTSITIITRISLFLFLISHYVIFWCWAQPYSDCFASERATFMRQYTPRSPQINISGCRAINLANSNMDSLFPRVLFNRDMCTSMLVWLIALFAGMCGFHLIAPCSILTSDYTQKKTSDVECVLKRWVYFYSLWRKGSCLQTTKKQNKITTNKQNPFLFGRSSIASQSDSHQ